MKLKLIAIITVLALLLTSCNFTFTKKTSGGDSGSKTNSTKSVQDDLIAYINEGLMPIADLEKQAVESYQSVSGQNYTDDNTMYEAMTKTVVPNYQQFRDKLVALAPQTKEVKEIHEVYINGVNSQLEGFKMVVEAIEKQDAGIIEQANVKLDAGKAGIDDFKSRINKLAEEYDVTITE